MHLCPSCGRLSEDSVSTCPVEGKELTSYTPSLSIGDKIGEKYRIQAAIGVGPSGEVYEGKGENDSDRVVVRVLSEEVCKDRRLSDVVRRHLLKQKDFDHKYVVRIREVDTRNDRLVVVRDWLDGERLEDVLRRDGALPVRRTLDLAVRICAALAEAHKVGLLHLQLRASNVFLVRKESGDGESVRLVDFGIGPRCKVGARPVYGQPGTLSPEQIEGKIVSFKSDMFSAGLLLYRMLAGSLPWSGEDDGVVRQILDAPVPPIKYRPDSPIPMELWAFIRQTLEKKPIHRPIGMAQMAEKLRELEGDAAAGRLSIEPPAPADEAEGAAAAKAPERVGIGKISLKQKAIAPPAAPSSKAPAPAAEDAEKKESSLEIDVELPLGEGKPAEVAPAAAIERKPAEEPIVRAPTIQKATDEPSGDVAEKEGPVAAGKAREQEAPVAPPQKAEGKAVEPVALTGPKERPPVPPMRGKAGSAAAPSSATTADDADARKRTAGDAEGKHDRPAPSSATLPMEPEIIEEAMVPPPLREPKGSRAGPPPRPGDAAIGGAYRRGLAYGIGIGVAIAIIVFLLFRLACPTKTAGGPGPTADTTAAMVTDGGEPGTQLTAEGPMQVTAIPADAGASETSGAGDVTPGAVDAAPEATITDVQMAPEQPAEPDIADTASAIDPGRTADAGTRPPGTDTGAASRTDAATRPEGGRADTAATVRADAGGTASGDNLARANELVTQGDQALAGRDFGAARSAYEEALRLQGNNNRAKIGLGRVAFQEGDFEGAVRYLEPIYRNQGNMDLGVAYVRLGRLADAKRQFEKLLERNPNNSDAQRALEAVRRQLGE